MRILATAIVQRLQSAGHEAFWVGGCVRDTLLGKEPKDYDIATSARPEEVERLFRQTIPVGRQFGVLLVVENGISFQVATFRQEADYRDGRHPEQVTFAGARADARRRDFTINGLFFDPVGQALHDWVGGREDLEQRRIRTIGRPEERFAEDHLRLLRVVRFAAQLDFTIEPETLEAVGRMANRIVSVSAERIREELIRLFAPPHAAAGLESLRSSGLLPRVLPEAVPLLTCDQSPEYHPEGTVYEHVRRMLALLPADADPALPWAVLLHDIAKPASATRDPSSGVIHFYGHERLGAVMAEELLTRLRFPRRLIDQVVACVRHHMQFKDVRRMRRATLRKMLLRPTFALELELHRLDCLGSHGLLDHYEFLQQQQREFDAQPALRPPLVNGNDLLALGWKPGPALGEALSEIRDLQLQEELRSRDEALAWARQRQARAQEPGRGDAEEPPLAGFEQKAAKDRKDQTGFQD